MSREINGTKRHMYNSKRMGDGPRAKWTVMGYFF
jgi:hypothetical protein